MLYCLKGYSSIDDAAWMKAAQERLSTIESDNQMCPSAGSETSWCCTSHRGVSGWFPQCTLNHSPKGHLCSGSIVKLKDAFVLRRSKAGAASLGLELQDKILPTSQKANPSI